MKYSIALPQVGPLATRAAVDQIAGLAEEIGLDGVWALDRLLAPLRPSEPYPARADGVLPDAYRHILDPMAILAFVAARTRRVAIGTSVLATPWYSPMVLARQLATIDVLSDGRLKVGLGTGWSSDENTAAAAPTGNRGERTDDFVETLITAWTADVVAIDTPFTRVPASHVDLKPVQRPHPPLLFAAYAPGSMRRLARYGAGWMPAGVPIDVLPGMLAAIREMAAEHGRRPDAIELVVRANVELTDDDIAGDRADFTGSLDQVLADIDRCAAIGAAEVLIDAQFSVAGRSVSAYAGFVTEVARHRAHERQLVAR